MKRMLFLFAIVSLLIFGGCGKDDKGLSIRELLTKADSWDLTSISEDPNNAYENVVALHVSFYSNGEYEYYIAFDGGSWEDGSGDWELSGNQLSLIDDDLVFTVHEITTLIARLEDNDEDAILNFEANT